MKIFRALKSNLITQKFGIKGTKLNMIAFYNSIGLKAHNGFDFLAKDGEPLYWDCDLDGEVIYISNDVNLGFGTDILTRDQKEGMYKHRHWHLKEIKCKVGQILKAGDLLGLADNTGKYTTGTHDHRDLKPVSYNQNGILYNLQQNNGYFGAVDIEPFFNNVFILDWVKINNQKMSIIKKLIELYKQVIELLKGRS